MVSSFLGVTLGLQDFLADGFKIEKTLRGRLLLGLMTFVPPFLASVLFPNIFLQALRLAGGFGVALLLGLLPVLMVWRGRYVLGFEGRVLLRGGRWVLSLMVLFVALELACEIYHLLG
jgi:tyrosine-specific transport protein